MKLFLLSHSALLAAVFLMKSGTAEAVLRGQNLARNEFLNLADWDVDAIHEIHQHHGRQLQDFSSMESCVVGLVQMGLAQSTAGALCSCVINDGNPFDYCVACGNAFVSSGFSLTKTDEFDKWFSESSEMTLAQTGTYYVSMRE